MESNQSITLGELHRFHSVDRYVFSKLVFLLKIPPTQALLVIALWLWLEEATRCKNITKLARLSNNLLEALVNEGNLCINFLKSKTPITEGGRLCLTSGIIEKELSLSILSQFKYTAIAGVKAYLNKVCGRVFTDILLQVLPINYNLINLNITPLPIPGFPHPTFGSLEIFVLPPYYILPRDEVWGWRLPFEAPVDDRTLFLTFSRGFPVSAYEAKKFFTRMCGDCIENFEMEVIDGGKVQTLYAEMVLKSVAFMDQIMKGQYVGKFRTNGKHIWARKFERRD